MANALKWCKAGDSVDLATKMKVKCILSEESGFGLIAEGLSSEEYCDRV